MHLASQKTAKAMFWSKAASVKTVTFYLIVGSVSKKATVLQTGKNGINAQ